MGSMNRIWEKSHLITNRLRNTTSTRTHPTILTLPKLKNQALKSSSNQPPRENLASTHHLPYPNRNLLFLENKPQNPLSTNKSHLLSINCLSCMMKNTPINQEWKMRRNLNIIMKGKTKLNPFKGKDKWINR